MTVSARKLARVRKEYTTYVLVKLNTELKTKFIKLFESYMYY